MMREINFILTVIQVFTFSICLSRSKSISSKIIEDSNFTNPGVRILDGDILIPTDFVSGSGRDGITLEGSKWKNRTVPLYINSSDFNENEEQMILDGIEEINRKTCIWVREWKQGDVDYVYVYKGKGCWSYLGRIGGHQFLSLGNGCLPPKIGKGYVIHEILHALGILHEHNRFDRDDYIIVHYDRIPSEWLSQYEKYSERAYSGPTAFASNFGLPYDYNSIMHYPKECPGREHVDAITVKNDPNNVIKLGHKQELSILDIKRVHAMYQCPLFLG